MVALSEKGACRLLDARPFCRGSNGAKGNYQVFFETDVKPIVMAMMNQHLTSISKLAVNPAYMEDPMSGPREPSFFSKKLGLKLDSRVCAEREGAPDSGWQT